MGIYKNYMEYKALYPSYEQWKSERDLQNAKRLEYLNQNPVNEEQKQNDIARGKALLKAIDVMDDYSQDYAEDTEVATVPITQGAVQTASMGGLVLFTALGALKPVNNFAAKFLPQSLKSFAPMILGAAGSVLLSFAATVSVTVWSAGQQVKASRYGRFEAMEKDLANPVHFAVLTDEQKNQAKKIAASLPDKDFQKNAIKEAGRGLINPLKRLKDVILGNKAKDAAIKEFSEELTKHSQNFDRKLSPQDIERAKKDAQLLGKIVENIDIASQDYAENVEFATNTLEVVAFAGGGLIGFISSKLMKLFNVKNPKIKTFLPGAIGLAVPLVFSIAAAKIQKEGSRIGRFKVKQELEKNPQELLYVDDEKAGNVNVAASKPKKMKNIFTFMKDAFKDNKEYQNWKKTQGLQNKKMTKALNQIELSAEQQKQAQMLQKNAFKTFNKMDEKSQLYAESTEAFWEIIREATIVIATAIGSVFSIKAASKMQVPAELDKIGGSMMKTFAPLIPAILLKVGLDYICTTEQKKASRTANMEALKELNDYRHYADYENAAAASAASTSLLARFKN